MKKNSSVEEILKDLWKTNEPSEEPIKERTLIRPGGANEGASAVESLEKREKLKRKKTMGGKQKSKKAREKKKEQMKRSEIIGKKTTKSWITSKGKEKRFVPRAKIKTGVKGLDPLLGGGMEEGSSFIIYGTPHCGKKPVIMQIAYSALKAKIPVIFILTDFGAKRWKEMMNESEWKLDRFADKVYFIDAYSQQYSILKDEENITYLQVPFPLSTLSIECTKFIETCEMIWKKKPVIIMHSLSTLIQNFGEAEVFNFLQFFLGKLGNESITSIYSLQSEMYSERIETMIVSMIDGVLEMRDMRLRAKGFLSIKTQDWVPYTMDVKGIKVGFKEEKAEKRATRKEIKKKPKKVKKAKKVKKLKRKK